MKEWLTRPEAALLTGRSRRTIRRWVHQELIRTKVDDDGRTQLLYRDDVLEVETDKSAYLNTPTFGRLTA